MCLIPKWLSFFKTLGRFQFFFCISETYYTMHCSKDLVLFPIKQYIMHYSQSLNKACAPTIISTWFVLFSVSRRLIIRYSFGKQMTISSG